MKRAEWLRLARLTDAAEIQRRGFTMRPSRTMLAKRWMKAESVKGDGLYTVVGVKPSKGRT